MDQCFLCFVFGTEELVATIEAIFGDVVTTVQFTGGLIDTQGWTIQGIMRTTHVTT
jgi:hypothetical protein